MIEKIVDLFTRRLSTFRSKPSGWPYPEGQVQSCRAIRVLWYFSGLAVVYRLLCEACLLLVSGSQSHYCLTWLLNKGSECLELCLSACLSASNGGLMVLTVVLYLCLPWISAATFPPSESLLV